MGGSRKGLWTVSYYEFKSKVGALCAPNHHLRRFSGTGDGARKAGYSVAQPDYDLFAAPDALGVKSGASQELRLGGLR